MDTTKQELDNTQTIQPQVEENRNGLHEVLQSDIEKTTRGVEHDDAADLFAGTGDVFEYTDAEAVKVRWKLDLILMSMMTFSYILSFCDKVALSNASIFGIRSELKLVGQQYSWASSIFYFGYLIAQYPSSILMQKYHIGRYLGIMIALWGVTTTCHAATTDFATLAVARFFLGIFESALSPVLVVTVSQYWTRREQGLRASIWWAGGGVGGFIVDGITYAVSGGALASSKYETWQILYLIFGPVTIAWGIFLFFFFPRNPMTAWFLSERERKIAVMRVSWRNTSRHYVLTFIKVIKNHTGIENRHYRLYQVKECLKDYQAWVFWSLALLQAIVGSGLTNFDKIVITGLGYSDRQADLMSFPGDTIQLVSVCLAGLVTALIPNFRLGVSLISNCVVLIGASLISALPTSMNLSRLAGLYIMYVNTITYIMVMSMISTNVAGFTKKATCGVMVFIGYAIGQIIAPQFFISTESPSYPTGFRAFYVSTGLMILFQISLL